MTPYTCIIFDMDGTLTATNRLIFDSFNYIVVEEGKPPMSDSAIMGLFGPPEEGALEKIVGPDRIEETMKKYLAYYEEHHDRLASLHEGIRSLLECLRAAGKKTAVFTGKGRFTTEITLRQLRLAHLFDSVVTGNDVGRHKPSGEGIRRIMAEHGAEPASTVMIGDSPADIKAARDAGVAVVSVLWDAHSPEKVLSMQPDFVFRQVEELREWLCE